MRTAPAIVAYVAEMTTAGARFRTTTSRLPARMFTFGEQAAVISIQPIGGASAACFLSHTPTVTYLQHVFMTLWRQADDFAPPAPAVALASDIEQQVVSLLSVGYDQATIADLLGVNPRACSAVISRLKQEVGVDTLLQLGLELPRRGAQPDPAT
jgi:hypothetical protein